MTDILKPVRDAVERHREPVAWLTRRRKDGTRELAMGEATTNPAYRDAHSLWEWVPLYEARPAETTVERERGELIDALRKAERLYSTNALLAQSTECGEWINETRELLAKYPPKEPTNG